MQRTRAFLSVCSNGGRQPQAFTESYFDQLRMLFEIRRLQRRSARSAFCPMKPTVSIASFRQHGHVVVRSFIAPRRTLTAHSSQKRCRSPHRYMLRSVRLERQFGHCSNRPTFSPVSIPRPPVLNLPATLTRCLIRGALSLWLMPTRASLQFLTVPPAAGSRKRKFAEAPSSLIVNRTRIPCLNVSY